MKNKFNPDDIVIIWVSPNICSIGVKVIGVYLTAKRVTYDVLAECEHGLVCFPAVPGRYLRRPGESLPEEMVENGFLLDLRPQLLQGKATQVKKIMGAIFPAGFVPLNSPGVVKRLNSLFDGPSATKE
jgi:hypothetical protein